MIGQLVTSKAGHDKGTMYVVVAADDEYVYVSDGKLKLPEKPKKKRIRHIQPINAYVGQELIAKLKSKSTVYAEEIKYALKNYSKQM